MQDSSEVVICDPEADPAEAEHEYGLTITNTLPRRKFDALVLAVRHREIVDMGAKRLRQLLKPNGVIYDLKGVLQVSERDAGL